MFAITFLNDGKVQIAKLLKLPRSTVGKVIRTYKERLSTERKPGSGRKTGFQNTNFAVRIRRNPNLSERTVANEFGTSKATVHPVKVKAGLKTYKIQKVPDRDQEKERRAKSRARKLYNAFFTKFNCCVMDDETHCVADFSQIPSQEFYVASQRGKPATFLSEPHTQEQVTWTSVVLILWRRQAEYTILSISSSQFWGFNAWRRIMSKGEA
ncbi:hypothetical protein ILUMI_23943 [Ignelater luminosus]|uniref:Transposase n=1 Tax=Ignelater luminosus TaxID=2038154 RepID=A0A8K0CEE9_IGNLU|nr:hypothetical protein ILUMI_23943 [Ignelater luminosus]